MTERRFDPVHGLSDHGLRMPRRGSHPRGDLPALLGAAVRGEDRAWSALTARFGPAVRRVARRHHLDEAEQDDVVQRTWLRLLRNGGTLRDADALPAWLATVARNESLRVLAARRDVPVDDPRLETAADPEDVDEQIVAEERRRALHRAIDALPERQRTLMLLLATEAPPSYDRLSSMLGMPVGSIGPTRMRCLERLRRDPHLARAVGVRPLPATDPRKETL
jgi:RNA polymerase sigma factor (sigma-70 family)